LPTASFWSANAERLELLPVEVTVPLLRLYALHEEAVRKLALASTIPEGAVAGALSAVETAARPRDRHHRERYEHQSGEATRTARRTRAGCGTGRSSKT